MFEKGGRKYGQAELGRQLGISKNAVHSWVNDKAPPDDTNIQRLALHFGVSVGFIYDLLDRKPPPGYDKITDAIMAIVYRLTGSRKSGLLRRLKEEGSKYDTDKKD